MTIEVKTLAQAKEIALADIRSRLTGADTTEHGPMDGVADLEVTARKSVEGHALGRYNATRAQHATGADLVGLAKRNGLTPKTATICRGLLIEVEVAGSGTWLANMAMTTGDGLDFKATAGGSWSEDGIVEFAIESVDTGTQVNLPVGQELTITSPPAGMESTAVVSGWDLSHVKAIDDESDSALQGRLAAALDGPDISGNEEDYKEFILADDLKHTLMDNGEEIPGDVFMYPKARFEADMTAAPLIVWDGKNRIPSGAGSFFTDIETYVDSVRPPGVDFDAVIVQGNANAIRVTLDADDGYGRDWGTSATTSILTAAATHTTTRIYLAASPSTEGLDVGHHVMMHVPTRYNPVVRRVIAVDNTANFIDIDEPTRDESGAKVAMLAAGSQDVRPAGPLSQAVVDKIQEMYSILTPSDTAAGIRWPKISQQYPCDITSAMIYRAIRDASDRIWDITINSGTATCPASAVSGGVLQAEILISPTAADDWMRVEFNQLNL